MAVRVAINGFGRIGRLTLRAALEAGRKDIEVVAINDLGSVDMNALLLQNDSTHGRLAKPVKVTSTGINAGSGVSSRYLPNAIRKTCPGASSTSTSCSNARVFSPSVKWPPSISQRARRKC